LPRANTRHQKYDKVFFEVFATEYIKTHVRLELKSQRDQEYLINQMTSQFQGKCLHQIDALMIRQWMSRRLKVVHIPGTDHIFLNPRTAKPTGSIKKSFHTALRRSGITDFKFHDPRHTFASQLVRRSVDLYVVQKLLGHSTPKMTRRYVHLRSDQLKKRLKKSIYNRKNYCIIQISKKHGFSTLFFG